ncbi:hypothetical protein AND_010156 [Anopheles darlingi]|uniref:Chitin-binding type-2 domain-containing protein n=1 Tax=Anopheles darlingi TaxID=43151 RepID=W5J5W6_ANODA|nr:hypothetical protein AND_010156 [Anopheles darlingi]
MRSLLLLGVLVTASNAFIVQNAPCSGSTVCLINCAADPRCPIFNPVKPVLLRASTCDRFYKCESGRACEMQCPSGTHYNEREQACDWPTRACCDPSVPCQPDPCGPGGDCTNPAPPPGPIIPIPPPQPLPPSPIAPGPPCSGSTVCLINCALDSRCPVFNPVKPVLLPGQTCDYFYKCESGRACLMQCPTGTHFNTREQACDWPSRACCDPSVPCQPDPCGPGGSCNNPPAPIYPPPQPLPPPPPPPPVYPPPPNPGLPCGGTGICSSSCPVDSRCPPFNPSKPVLLSATTCERYLKCESGRACPMNCPPGLHFNVRTQICDWPFQACCDPSIECRPDPCPPGAFGCNSNQNKNNNWLFG